jgi:hypothetical protein
MREDDRELTLASKELLPNGFDRLDRSVGISLEHGVGRMQRELAVGSGVGRFTTSFQVFDKALFGRTRAEGRAGGSASGLAIFGRTAYWVLLGFHNNTLEPKLVPVEL